MQKKVKEFIREHKMVKPGDRVVVAVSGGADSVCLLCLLAELREELGIELAAVHVHHGLRGEEADRDAAFTRNLAEGLGIPCTVVHKDVAGYAKALGKSVEEAGRELRYQALHEAASAWGGAKIAVAHHREDQAETILHNLFRGSAIKGLSGMAAVRGAVIRPLLCVGRADILRFLEERGLEYCTDSTNCSEDYTRNRLRRRLIPEICREINPGAVEHIVNAGERLRQADEYFEKLAADIWKESGRREVRDGKACCGIGAGVLRKQPEIVKGYVVRYILEQVVGSMKDITSLHISQVCGLAEKGTGKRVCLPYGAEGWIEYDTLWIGRKCPRQEEENDPAVWQVEISDEQVETVCNQVTAPACPLHFCRIFREKHQEIPQNRYTKWFDYDKIKDTLSVRTRQTGDYITLKDGKKKTVKAYMIDEKIPRQERDRILLLAEGNHILWIVGYRISEYYKITENTKQILQVQTDGGKEHGR